MPSSSSRTGRLPGLDRIPIEFHTEFSAKLTSVLKAVYDESLANGKLPQTLTQATVSVLLKKIRILYSVAHTGQ